MDTPTTPDLSGAVAAELRAELGRQRVTVRALADKLGRPRSWVQRRLSGEVLTLDDLHLIATALDLDPRSLFERAAS